MLAAGLAVKLLVVQAWHQPVAWDNSNEISVVLAADLTGVIWALVLSLGLIAARRAWSVRSARG